MAGRGAPWNGEGGAEKEGRVAAVVVEQGRWCDPDRRSVFFVSFGEWCGVVEDLYPLGAGRGAARLCWAAGPLDSLVKFETLSFVVVCFVFLLVSGVDFEVCASRCLGLFRRA